MGRELKRKQAKKDKKPLKEEIIQKNESPYEDIYKLLKTFGIMLAIILALYLFIAIVITKEIEWFSKDEDKEEIVTVANSILAKNTFTQKEDEYFVYFYDFNEEDKSVTNLVSGMLSDTKVYKVNTNDAFNSNYVTLEKVGNSSANSLDNLKVINPTLIKISGDTIVEYYETSDSIKGYLENK